MNEFNENIEGNRSELIKCPCGHRGRFRLYRGNGMMLCLDCMQFWLSEKLKGWKKNEKRNKTR